GVWLGQALWWAVGRWSAGGEPRVLLDVIANIVHNGALLVIMAEACLIYATAGWYKVQGSRWQDGTAVHYPLQLEYFSP
ncbi:HTTM domain-containing protein, partial [Streptomyces sp. TRM76130]|nr:HTTM domain-containing protein [Streptomyces sp. TRM76130]